MEDIKVETISLAAHESIVTRLTRIIKYLIMGWAFTLVAMGLVLVISFSYSEEVMTETETITQDSGDYGSNHYIGGDLNGEANYNEDGDYDDEDAGAGGDSQ